MQKFEVGSSRRENARSRSIKPLTNSIFDTFTFEMNYISIDISVQFQIWSTSRFSRWIPPYPVHIPFCNGVISPSSRYKLRMLEGNIGSQEKGNDRDQDMSRSQEGTKLLKVTLFCLLVEWTWSPSSGFLNTTSRWTEIKMTLRLKRWKEACGSQKEYWNQGMVASHI